MPIFPSNALLPTCMASNMSVDHPSLPTPEDLGILQYEDLHQAIEKRDVEALRAMLAQDPAGNASALNAYDETPLMTAVRSGHTELVQALLDSSCYNRHQCPKQNGGTALILDVLNGHSNIIVALLAHPNIDVNIADSQENTAMHHAVKWKIGHDVLHA